MTNPNNGLFETFTPAPLPAGDTVFAEQEAPAASAPKKRKTGKKASAKPSKKAAAAPKPVATKSPKGRKRASAPANSKTAPKFTVDQVLLATAGLKETDRQAFNQFVSAFYDIGKPARVRILAVLGKLFND